MFKINFQRNFLPTHSPLSILVTHEHTGAGQAHLGLPAHQPAFAAEPPSLAVTWRSSHMPAVHWLHLPEGARPTRGTGSRQFHPPRPHPDCVPARSSDWRCDSDILDCDDGTQPGCDPFLFADAAEHD